MFTLNDTQRSALLAARAWHDESERRFDHWSRRESLLAATQAFGLLLRDSGLKSGRALSDDDRKRLLRFAADLAPNSNLSRRLYAGDPKSFDKRLRDLLFGTAPLPTRIKTFVSVRGTGALTAAQLLSAAFPETYPLITRAALRRLRLTAAQKREAVHDASERFGFDVTTPPDAVHNLLGLFIVYAHVRTALGVNVFAEADDLLRADWDLMPTLIHDAIVREHTSSYNAADTAVLTEATLLTGLEEYALSQGFTFPPHLLRSYYIALKTKPFAILSGVSGTGKTKMAEILAEGLTGHHPDQFRLIPVRPDWADSTPLFGYHNILANRYVSTPFLDMARQASLPENRDRAFFVCLDEMNLARVEHYLADYLSALESRSHSFPLHEDTPDLFLPANLFVTGTVNVDETTHAFSRKVLDRANTLDFDAAPVLLDGLTAAKGLLSLQGALGATPAQRQTLFLRARITNIGRARERLSQVNPAFPVQALALLQLVNDKLYPHRLHFAYRVRDDILAYLANSFDGETGQGLLLADPQENFTLGLDLQFLQKILPKLNGLAEMLEPLLQEVQIWAGGEGLPRTSAKIARMRAHGMVTGYIRFYE